MKDRPVTSRNVREEWIRTVDWEKDSLIEMGHTKDCFQRAKYITLVT